MRSHFDEQLAELNRQIRQERKKQALCREILDRIPQMETEIQKAENHSLDVHEKGIPSR